MLVLHIYNFTVYSKWVLYITGQITDINGLHVLVQVTPNTPNVHHFNNLCTILLVMAHASITGSVYHYTLIFVGKYQFRVMAVTHLRWRLLAKCLIIVMMFSMMLKLQVKNQILWYIECIFLMFRTRRSFPLPM